MFFFNWFYPSSVMACVVENNRFIPTSYLLRIHLRYNLTSIEKVQFLAANFTRVINSSSCNNLLLHFYCCVPEKSFRAWHKHYLGFYLLIDDICAFVIILHTSLGKHLVCSFKTCLICFLFSIQPKIIIRITTIRVQKW